MIQARLFVHQYKSLARSPNLKKEMGVRIAVGVMVLVVAVNLLALGLYMKELLGSMAPGKEPVSIFNGFILYYLWMDLLLRLMMQAVPGLSLRSYLHLPVRRSTLVHFLLFKTMGSIFNYLPLLIIVPFTLMAVLETRSILSAIAWLSGIFFLLLANGYLAVYFNRMLLRKKQIIIPLLVIFIVLPAVNYLGWLPVTSASSFLFDSILYRPYLLILPLLWFAMVYMLNYRTMMGRLYLEQLERKQGGRDVRVRETGLLTRFGVLGDYIGLELKLISRNKRLRHSALLGFPFLLFGFFVYSDAENARMIFFLIYFGILLTGYFMVNYGQFLLAWESEYFDLVLILPIQMKQYLRTKFIILAGSCVILYLFLAPFALYDPFFLFVNSMLLLFNIGIGATYLLWTATSNRVRIDVQASSFSWQGRGGKQVILVFILIALPMILYYPVFWLTKSITLAVLSLGLVGLAGIVLNNRLLGHLVTRFSKYKYLMAAGFRKNV